MKTLIVYFSHNHENYVNGQIQNLNVGNTKVVALKMQKMLGADIFEIKPLHDILINIMNALNWQKKNYMKMRDQKLRILFLILNNMIISI